MTTGPSSMKKFKEDHLFQRGVEYVHHSARGIKKINSQELASLNRIQAEVDDDEPWRFSSAAVTIGGGEVHHFNIVSNPVNRARELCGTAVQMAGNGDSIEGALYLYVELVLAHLFNDANRRTAALASLWILESAGHTVDPKKLIDIPIGNLRDAGERSAFETRFRKIVDANS